MAAEPRLFFDGDGATPETAFAFTETEARSGRVVVAISSDCVGSPEFDRWASDPEHQPESRPVSDKEHGAELLRIFLESLCERNCLPDEIVLYGRGVLLAAETHPALKSIRLLCHREVVVKICSESLDFYKTKPAESNVQPVPMSEITRTMMRANQLIRP